MLRNHRAFMLEAMVAIFLLLVGTGNCTKAKTPNVLFIMTDDQDFLLNSMNFMPNVKKQIGNHGVTFQSHYCTTALCCPSRSSIMTGKCVHNTNVTDVKVPYGGYAKFVTEGLNEDYLALWLQAGGIDTYYVGKFTNGHNINNYLTPALGGWTHSHFLLDPGMYDYLNTTWTYDNGPPKSYLGENSIDLVTKNALNMLDTAVQGGKPWFMTVAPAVPHVGINASGNGETFFPIPQSKWANAFSKEIVPRTPNWNPSEASGVSWVLNLPQQNQSVVNGLDMLYRDRIRCVAGIDDMVGDLISALSKYGQLENTHIIFTTDNGYHIGQHRMGPGKKAGFETDVNVPMVWRGPGVPSGKVSHTVSTHTDLAPTFLDIFGLPLRTKLDGQPMIDVLPEAHTKPGEHINIEHWGAANPYEVDPYTSISIPGEQNNTYKGLRIVGNQYSLYYSVWCTNEHELYDMKTDYYQMANLLPKTYDIKGLSSNKQLLGRPMQQVVYRLDALMMVLKSCVEVECTLPWSQLHPQGNVATLQDALNPRYDDFYAAQPKVSFSACMPGYLLEYEGPQTAMVYSGK